ncbi:hypothetical protein ACHWQZ_G005459 [Mnemiopsis leidyi]
MLSRLNQHSSFVPELARKLSGVLQMKEFNEGTQHNSKPVTSITEKGIQLDGKTLLHVETRNMCKCEVCFGKHSHQRNKLPPIGNASPAVKVEEIGKVTSQYVSLKWSDGHEGLIARTVRGEYGPGVIESRVRKWLDLTRRKNVEQEFWSTPNEEVTKVWDYSWVVSSGDNTREFLAHYMRFGIGLMNGVPKDLGMKDILSEGLKIGPIRRTSYEEVDYVRFKPNPSNSAYGTDLLPLHTDLASYFEAPHVQFFHCMESTVEGGESFWVDTFAAIKTMSEQRPDLLEVLKTVPMTFRYTPPGRGVFQLSQHPVVKMCGKDIWQTVDIIWSMDTAQFTRDEDLETRERWWEAFLYYRELVEDQDSWFVKKLRGGEFVITDNWRVLHARKEFRLTAPDQERIVSTSYMDWNSMANRVLSSDKGEHVFLEVDQH